MQTVAKNLVQADRLRQADQMVRDNLRAWLDSVQAACEGHLLEGSATRALDGGDQQQVLDQLHAATEQAAHKVGVDSSHLLSMPSGANEEIRTALKFLVRRSQDEERALFVVRDAMSSKFLFRDLGKKNWADLATRYQLNFGLLEESFREEELHLAELFSALGEPVELEVLRQLPDFAELVERKVEAKRRFRGTAARLLGSYNDTFLGEMSSLGPSSTLLQKKVLGVLRAKRSTAMELADAVAMDVERWLQEDGVLHGSAGAEAGPSVDFALARLSRDLQIYQAVDSRHADLDSVTRLEFEDYMAPGEAEHLPVPMHIMQKLAFRCGVQAESLSQFDFMQKRQGLLTRYGYSEDELEMNPAMRLAAAQHKSTRDRLVRARRRFENLFQNELAIGSEQTLHEFVALLSQAPAKVRQYETDFPDVPLQSFKVELDNFKMKIAQAYNARQRELILLTHAVDHWELWVQNLLLNPEDFMASLSFKEKRILKAYHDEAEHFFRRHHHCSDMNWDAWRQCPMHELIDHSLNVLQQSVRLRNRLGLTRSLCLHPNWQPKAWQLQLDRMLLVVGQQAQLAADKSTLDRQLSS